MPVSQSARERVRVEISREILSSAHEELAQSGAAGLSLRAVARRLGMVPSALYRYFPSREALLTALIIEAYEAVGEAAAAADRGGGRSSGGPPGGRASVPARGAALKPLDRWLSVAAGVRAWAHAHPHQWALIYGSPVPGYAAPEQTVESAMGITRVIAGIFADAVPGRVGDKKGATALPPAPKRLAAALRPIETELLPGRPPEVVVATMLAWTQLLGMVSLELFGHYVGATTDFEAVFLYAMGAIGTVGGLSG
jgi:AcrR family transcriptional regulator